MVRCGAMRRGVLATTLLCVPWAGAAQAQAQDGAEARRMDAIEAQIRTLQDELRRMRRGLADRDAQLRAARQDAATARQEARRQAQAAPAGTPGAAPPGPGAGQQAAAPDGVGAGLQTQAPGQPQRTDSGAAPSTSAPPAPVNPGGLSFPSGRPTFTSNDGRFSVAVGLQLHYDVGGYFQSERNPETRAVPRLNTFGQNLRRGRLPFVFKYDDFQINVTPEFGGSPDGSPTLYEANINYIPVRPVTLTVGYFKPWLTLGDSTSSNDFLFLERPSIVDIARNIAGGDARSSAGVRLTGDRWFVAGYLTGGSYGSQQGALAQPQQTGGTLRLAGRPVATDDWDVHIGFSASRAFRIQRTASGQTLNLQDRPELRIDQNRLVSTGPLNADGADEYGPEFAVRWRNFMLQGEYIRIGVDRRATATGRAPDLSFHGGYVEGSWVITGEPRRYSTSSAAFGNPRPADPVTFKSGGGYGAFEAVARYSHVDLNDRVTRGIAAAVTGGVYGGTQDIYALGLNWYLNNHLRMVLNYDIIQVDRLNAAGRTQVGQRIQALAVRAQAAF